MDTRKAATEYRLTQWAQMLQARQASGQSIEDFCATAGISRNTYFYWQRKLREAACTELIRQDAQVEPIPCEWTRLEIAETCGKEETLAIEIGGCRVMATRETDPELLAKVCRILKAL